MADTIHTQPELSDDELLRVYGLAKRDHYYEGSINDWPKLAERAATVAGLRAAIAADRARAALAQPEPEGPSDEDVEAAAQRIYEAMRFERVEATPVWSENGNSFAQDAAREAARAVLARWGRPAPQPVPVSERWPEFSDCDNAERVWCWSWAIGTWRLSRINQSIHSHWLPAHALPIPSESV